MIEFVAGIAVGVCGTFVFLGYLNSRHGWPPRLDEWKRLRRLAGTGFYGRD